MIFTVIFSIFGYSCTQNNNLNFACIHHLIHPLENKSEYTPLIFPLFTINKDNYQIKQFSLFVWNRFPILGDEGEANYNDTRFENQTELLEMTNIISENIQDIKYFGTSPIYSFQTDQNIENTMLNNSLRPILFTNNLYEQLPEETPMGEQYIYSLFSLGNYIEHLVIKIRKDTKQKVDISVNWIEMNSEEDLNYLTKNFAYSNCIEIDNDTTNNKILENLKKISENKVTSLIDNEPQKLTMVLTNKPNKIKEYVSNNDPYVMKLYDGNIELKIEINKEEGLFTPKEFIAYTVFVFSITFLAVGIDAYLKYFKTK